ncbi:glutathione S-transferase family protein [Methylobacterium frigidaeris]|uniref:GST-like protein YibF n=1 Tax=Methylobacterium frigidaeris TaxID=2038277 RepID=A0AA37H5X4_9HYPH|nr:glutathione S-transferase [Methylobacterium frigidaeris]PIK72226.1 glutathione S-transferase [Methylobacterium frigidaeris]GJD59990.1 putative GST-like protein YibF [Methylobacterium frigidaeris]
MKLFYAKASPFVRKVLVVAHELGLFERIELLSAAAHPINRDANIRAQNPLAQVPTLILDDGTMLADSRVICEYLDHLGQGGFFPAPGPARWTALTAQSTGDGLLDAALLCVYETRVRQETERSPAWVAGQREKIVDALAQIEAAAPAFGERVDIATITYGCGLGYLDLRLPDLGWRERAPAAAEWYARFGARPSMQATRPE